MSEESPDNTQMKPVNLDLGNGYYAKVSINRVSDIVENDDGTGNINVDHDYDVVDSNGDSVKDHLSEQQLEDIDSYVGQSLEYFVINAIETQIRQYDENGEFLTENDKIERIPGENGDYYWGIVYENDPSE